VIFAARGLMVSLAFFAAVYCPLSLLTLLAWWGAKRIHLAPDPDSANLLFGLRVFPFAVSAAVTVFFTFPSFWLMERPSLDEDSETFILALCSLCILGAGLYRVLRVQRRTTSAVQQWRGEPTNFESAASTPTLSAAQGAPPLVLVGICKPRVLISDEAAQVLTDGELQVAVRHEISHARSWDNLKKVLVSATPFPGMGRLEKAWHEAAELAADDRAVTNRQEALDLASALIKLSRSCQQLPSYVFAAELVSGSSSINLRVHRLLKWRAAGRRSRRGWRWEHPVLRTVLITALLTTIVGIVSHYGAALVLTHRLTELLVP
jgi:beta-lactamase regulating signal transducer with metallopeptidase domain